MSDFGIDPSQFAATFQRFMGSVNALAPHEEPYFFRRLHDHFGQDPSQLPIVGGRWPSFDHANLQVAVERYLEGDGRSHQLVGILGQQRFFMGGLPDLIAEGHVRLRPGPVDHIEVPISADDKLPCIQFGLVLSTDERGPIAVLIRGPEERGPNSGVSADVMAPDRVLASSVLRELRQLIVEHNVYRGKVLSLTGGTMGGMRGDLSSAFHRLPAVERGAIVLPAGVLERIERHTVEFSRHRDTLLAAGRHLKRGLLLHGPPGTGKTFTGMYLASQMQGRTIIIIAAHGFGLIGPSCQLARDLQPSMVVMEDVDIIAEERTRMPGQNPLLFQLLNEMDGMADDADVVFLLTTNRPDLLEPALAMRPGRIDQAIELPLPDAGCRERLFRLYAERVTAEVDWTPIVELTEGASAAFIKELLRKAVLLAAIDGQPGRLAQAHVERAHTELAVEGGALTAILLGARTSPS